MKLINPDVGEHQLPKHVIDSKRIIDAQKAELVRLRHTVKALAVSVAALLFLVLYLIAKDTVK